MHALQLAEVICHKNGFKLSLTMKTQNIYPLKLYYSFSLNIFIYLLSTIHCICTGYLIVNNVYAAV